MVNEYARRNGENVISHEDVHKCAMSLFDSMNRKEEAPVSARIARLDKAGRKCQEQLDMLLWDV